MLACTSNWRASMRVICALAGICFVVSELASQTGDPNYKLLREAIPAETFSIDNLSLQRDVAQLTLQSGTVTFLTPVQDKRMLAVFRGEGTFEVAPITSMDRNYLVKLAGQEKPRVGFQRMLIAFSDSTYDEVKKAGKFVTLDPEAASAAADLRKKIRKEPDNEDNIEAELLADFYSPPRESSLMALMSAKYADDSRPCFDPHH